MKSKEFLLLNGIIVTILILLFFVGRRKQKPTVLDLKNKFKSNPALPEPLPKDLGNPENKGRYSHLDWEKINRIENEGQERSLNIIFNYNGHSWDAYEVLGVPAGGSPQMAREAYLTLVRSADEEDRKFFESALNAILSGHPKG